MVAPSALLSIQDGSGAVENQGQGFIQELTPGDIATFALQTSANVTPGLRWVLVFESAFTPQLDGLAFVWSPPIGRASFQVQLPPFGFLARYVTTIYDGQNALSQFTGEIEGSEGGTSSVGGDVIGPIGSNLVTSAHIPASVTSPVFMQTQAASGAGQTLRFRTQGAATGSAMSGGDMSQILGADDGAPGNPRLYWIGLETAAGGHEPATNYINIAIFKWLPGGVANLVIGGGTNAVGGGVAGAEISAFTQLSIATEGAASRIVLQPASSFGGQSFFTFDQSTEDGTPILALGRGAGGGGPDPVASVGLFRLPWATSTTLMQLMVQRNATDDGDLPILTRNINELYIGSFVESHRQHAKANINVEFFDQSGTGWVSSGVAGILWAVGTDNNKTLSHGASATASGWTAKLYGVALASTSAGQVIATLSTTTNAINRFKITVSAEDETTHEWTSFYVEQAYLNLGGTVTVATGGAAAQTAIQESNSGLAAGLSFTLTVSTTTVQVKVTPWASNSTFFVTRVETHVNTGAI